MGGALIAVGLACIVLAIILWKEQPPETKEEEPETKKPKHTEHPFFSAGQFRKIMKK